MCASLSRRVSNPARSTGHAQPAFPRRDDLNVEATSEAPCGDCRPWTGVRPLWWVTSAPVPPPDRLPFQNNSDAGASRAIARDTVGCEQPTDSPRTSWTKFLAQLAHLHR
jgi:hypothetical protein